MSNQCFSLDRGLPASKWSQACGPPTGEASFSLGDTLVSALTLVLGVVGSVPNLLPHSTSRLFCLENKNVCLVTGKSQQGSPDYELKVFSQDQFVLNQVKNGFPSLSVLTPLQCTSLLHGIIESTEFWRKFA